MSIPGANVMQAHTRDFRDRILNLAHEAGLARMGRGLWAKSLTVLNYHRIGYPQNPDFDSFLPNISATPEEFDIQIEYLARWFNLVSLTDVLAWMEDRAGLPPFAALITFDDGYLDNYLYARPVLGKYKLPAVIFLATGHIGTDTPFYWDLAAYCFHHTGRDSLTFPDGQAYRLPDLASRRQLCHVWIEQLKRMPEPEKQAWVARLPDDLEVAVPSGFFRKLMMNWNQIRELQASGFEFGAHTVNHPILTRIPLGQVQGEVAGSKARIEAELGTPVLSFAYPNGQGADFNAEIQRVVAGSGIKAAFTLLNGPSTLGEVRRDPMAIRRIFISHKHSLAHFAILTSRFNRYGLY